VAAMAAVAVAAGGSSSNGVSGVLASVIRCVDSGACVGLDGEVA
jgi:hypothetical protein